jgi:hypothetical protein
MKFNEVRIRDFLHLSKNYYMLVLTVLYEAMKTKQHKKLEFLIFTLKKHKLSS